MNTTILKIAVVAWGMPNLNVLSGAGAMRQPQLGLKYSF